VDKYLAQVVVVRLKEPRPPDRWSGRSRAHTRSPAGRDTYEMIKFPPRGWRDGPRRVRAERAGPVNELQPGVAVGHRVRGGADLI
jgi:hypothetical protein